MVELLRTNDPILLSWVGALLANQGIPAMVFYGHTAVLEGSVAAIQRRLMVSRDDAASARRLMAEAGVGDGGG